MNELPEIVFDLIRKSKKILLTSFVTSWKQSQLKKTPYFFYVGPSAIDTVIKLNIFVVKINH